MEIIGLTQFSCQSSYMKKGVKSETPKRNFTM